MTCLTFERAWSGDATGEDLISMTLDGHLIGCPVSQVQDIVVSKRLKRLPLVPTVVAGVLILRGRIVTAIDLRARFGLSQRPDGDVGMGIVVDHGGDLYSLMADRVGEVIRPTDQDLEADSEALAPAFRDVASGFFKLGSQPLIVLDLMRILDFSDCS
ncbi:MAG: chemotaxis protein CheW [Geminicoccaceae bacterium]